MNHMTSPAATSATSLSAEPVTSAHVSATSKAAPLGKLACRSPLVAAGGIARESHGVEVPGAALAAVRLKHLRYRDAAFVFDAVIDSTAPGVALICVSSS